MTSRVGERGQITIEKAIREELATYDIDQRTIIDTLIELIQRENVRVLGARTDVLVGMLVRARALPGRPIPDAMIVAAALEANAVPLATFDRDQRRYGIVTRAP